MHSGEPQTPQRKTESEGSLLVRGHLEEMKEEGGGREGVERIFVGGLGGSVTAGDIHKTFSSLGTVNTVEFVRSKGRSFAYMEFSPSSQNSLPKLFSTYNGCAWKGGKLRLEKAKEHYLVRLTREWAEDAQSLNKTTCDDVDPNAVLPSSDHPKKILNSEMMPLRLFFPRLKKVKSLPFKGTGKHKYSFQRVEVPPLPIHFCDCEEHFDHSLTVKRVEGSDPEKTNVGINDEEISIMNSVMNKLLERKDNEKAAITDTESPNKKDSSNEFDNGASYVSTDTEDDNIVTNMVTRPNNISVLTRSQKQGPSTTDQIAGQLSKGWPAQNKLRDHKHETAPSSTTSTSNKKRKKTDLVSSITPITDSARLPELLPTESRSGSKKPLWREVLGNSDDASFSISKILPDLGSSTKQEQSNPKLNSDGSKNQNLVKEEKVLEETLEAQVTNTNEVLEETLEAQPTNTNEVKAVHSKPNKGPSWLQKSSWTELVGQKNSSFSISNILPSVHFENEKSEAIGVFDANSQSKQIDLGNKGNGGPKEVGKQGFIIAPNAIESAIERVGNEVFAPKLVKNSHSEIKKTNPGVKIGEVCPFMRNEASEREWAKLKASLSGSLKKKANRSS